MGSSGGSQGRRSMLLNLGKLKSPHLPPAKVENLRSRRSMQEANFLLPAANLPSSCFACLKHLHSCPSYIKLFNRVMKREGKQPPRQAYIGIPGTPCSQHCCGIYVLYISVFLRFSKFVQRLERFHSRNVWHYLLKQTGQLCPGMPPTG